MQKPCQIVKLLHSVFEVYWCLEFKGDFYLGLVHSNNNDNNPGLIQKEKLDIDG